MANVFDLFAFHRRKETKVPEEQKNGGGFRGSSCRKRIPLNNRSRQVCVSMTFYNRGGIFEPPCQEDAKNVTFEFSAAIPVATKCFLYVVMTLLFNLSSGIKTEIFGTSEFCSLEQQSSRRI
ncbi:hypothetical protein NPIL_33301 [Nephila pilipes]|uniref:Uncharacterized protein n=1 Tax=Nephila pilipes TaxID=299642 RepID=A0A8X6PZK2_NEPPI|nr:hypothetical protein NPIL_33301 [Nephila pilipes]